jgi:hypothetical protein
LDGLFLRLFLRVGIGVGAGVFLRFFLRVGKGVGIGLICRDWSLWPHCRLIRRERRLHSWYSGLKGRFVRVCRWSRRWYWFCTWR